MFIITGLKAGGKAWVCMRLVTVSKTQASELVKVGKRYDSCNHCNYRVAL